MDRPPTLLESGLRHDRAILVAVLVLVPLLCWIWIVLMARDMYGAMNGPSAWMMTLTWDARHLLLFWAMWAVMMTGMMLPAAAPLVLLYGGAARRRADGERSALDVYALASGYVFVWAVFSVGATVLQRMLAGVWVLSPMMELSNPAASAALLVVAGAYQLTPLKTVCLQSCQAPVAFLSRHWRTGTAGAFRMGVTHGLYCVGCCWALMLLLFAGGVMNLGVIVALTLLVTAEKLALFGAQGNRVTGALLIMLGVWVFAR